MEQELFVENQVQFAKEPTLLSFSEQLPNIKVFHMLVIFG